MPRPNLEALRGMNPNQIAIIVNRYNDELRQKYEALNALYGDIPDYASDPSGWKERMFVLSYRRLYREYLRARKLRAKSVKRGVAREAMRRIWDGLFSTGEYAPYGEDSHTLVELFVSELKATELEAPDAEFMGRMKTLIADFGKRPPVASTPPQQTSTLSIRDAENMSMFRTRKGAINE